MRTLIFCLVFMQAGCQEVPIGPVRSYVLPEYPPSLQKFATEGTVRLTAEIGKDGKIVSVMWPTVPPEGLWGPEQTLVEAAQNNLCQWVFEPPSNNEVLPMRHDIEYVFKLEGNPVDNPKTRHIVDLPHRIVIISERGMPFGHILWGSGYLSERKGERPVFPCQTPD